MYSAKNSTFDQANDMKRTLAKHVETVQRTEFDLCTLVVEDVQIEQVSPVQRPRVVLGRIVGADQCKQLDAQDEMRWIWLCYVSVSQTWPATHWRTVCLAELLPPSSSSSSPAFFSFTGASSSALASCVSSCAFGHCEVWSRQGHMGTIPMYLAGTEYI